MNLYNDDCLNVLKSMDDNSVDSIVTDPPYGISFMNKHWDYDVPIVEIWQECLRVLKPGGYLLSFSSSRTYHRIAINIEDAGFEIRDMIEWVYGSGMPKSLNVSKAIDKKNGKTGKVVGKRSHPTLKDKSKIDRQENHQFHGKNNIKDEWDIIEPESEDAQTWKGWGTALKPAHEPICMARKPLSEKTVADNCLKHGTGAININDSRILYDENNQPIPQIAQNKRNVNSKKSMFDGQSFNKSKTNAVIGGSTVGRFPANLIHDGSDVVTDMFPNTGKKNKDGEPYSYIDTEYNNEKNSLFNMGDKPQSPSNYNDGGSSARFFYCAKSTTKERTCNGLVDNKHPTIKPIKLMKYLIKLVTQPGGIVLDPFMGSGTTGMASMKMGYDFIGIELDEEYFDVAKMRIATIESGVI
jgi:site-specific DNA-methyltransferase (adenine-specific)